MTAEITQEQIIDTYAKIKLGNSGAHSEAGFFGWGAEQIVDISAQELCCQIRSGSIRAAGDVLFAASEELAKGLMDDYYEKTIEHDGYKPDTQSEALDYLNNRPGELDKKYLPQLVAALNLVTDNPVGVMKSVGFRYFIDVVVSHITALQEMGYQWNGQTEVVKNLATKETEEFADEEYRSRLHRKLDVVLSNTNEVAENDIKVADAGLYLANYLWQVAFIMKYTVKNSVAEQKVAALSRLQSERDFASFNNMIVAVFEDRSKDHSIDESVILTAFKLFQDAAEYMDDPGDLSK